MVGRVSLRTCGGEETDGIVSETLFFLFQPIPVFLFETREGKVEERQRHLDQSASWLIPVFYVLGLNGMESAPALGISVKGPCSCLSFWPQILIPDCED